MAGLVCTRGVSLSTWFSLIELEVKYGRSQVYCYADKREELQRGFEATFQGEGGTLRRETEEATSLGLKTKLGLRPNSRDMVALIYK